MNLGFILIVAGLCLICFWTGVVYQMFLKKGVHLSSFSIEELINELEKRQEEAELQTKELKDYFNHLEK